MQSQNAEDPEFYNTAWTLKSLRGIFLWFVCAAAALPIAHFYNSPIMSAVLPVAALWVCARGVYLDQYSPDAEKNEDCRDSTCWDFCLS